MQKGKIYKARHNHPYLKEGTEIRFFNDDIFIWKYNDWFPLSVKGKNDFDFWSFHKDSFGNICPNLEHWQLVKENKGFEVNKFYKYNDFTNIYIFQIKEKKSVGKNIRYYIDIDSSIFFDSDGFYGGSMVGREAVEVTKEDIKYCLKEKAKEKGLYKGTKCNFYLENSLFIKYIYGNIEDFSLVIDFMGSAEYIFIDTKGDVLWRQNEGWLVEKAKEPEHIVTVEGERKYIGDKVYYIDKNNKVNEVTLVEDGMGNESCKGKKFYSYLTNALQYNMIYETVDMMKGCTKEFKNEPVNQEEEKKFTESDIRELFDNVADIIVESSKYYFSINFIKSEVTKLFKEYLNKK